VALEAQVEPSIGRQAIVAATRHVRLARTTTSGTYPSTPCDTYEIVFLDGTFTESAGDQTPTYTERSASPQAIAYDIRSDGLIPEDTEVLVLEQNGKWWIVARATLAQIVRVTLDEDMGASTAGQATATVVDYFLGKDPADGSGDIIVHDRMSLFARSLSGAKGIAVYDDRSDEYLLIDCQTKARFVEFTLDADLSGATQATVNDYWDGQDPADGSGDVDVIDNQGLFDNALSGAKGLAVYDPSADKYVIAACETMATRCTGQLTADMDSTDATATIDNVTPLDGQTPPLTGGTLTVYNDHDWAADDNALVRVEYKASTDTWHIYQVSCPA